MLIIKNVGNNILESAHVTFVKFAFFSILSKYIFVNYRTLGLDLWNLILNFVTVSKRKT